MKSREEGCVELFATAVSAICTVCTSPLPRVLPPLPPLALGTVGTGTGTLSLGWLSCRANEKGSLSTSRSTHCPSSIVSAITATQVVLTASFMGHRSGVHAETQRRRDTEREMHAHGAQ
jgi:hypothetical protein